MIYFLFALQMQFFHRSNPRIILNDAIQVDLGCDISGALVLGKSFEDSLLVSKGSLKQGIIFFRWDILLRFPLLPGLGSVGILGASKSVTHFLPGVVFADFCPNTSLFLLFEEAAPVFFYHGNDFTGDDGFDVTRGCRLVRRTVLHDNASEVFVPFMSMGRLVSPTQNVRFSNLLATCSFRN